MLGRRSSTGSHPERSGSGTNQFVGQRVDQAGDAGDEIVEMIGQRVGHDTDLIAGERKPAARAQDALEPLGDSDRLVIVTR